MFAESLSCSQNCFWYWTTCTHTSLHTSFGVFPELRLSLYNKRTHLYRHEPSSFGDRHTIGARKKQRSRWELCWRWAGMDVQSCTGCDFWVDWQAWGSTEVEHEVHMLWLFMLSEWLLLLLLSQWEHYPTPIISEVVYRVTHAAVGFHQDWHLLMNICK